MNKYRHGQINLEHTTENKIRIVGPNSQSEIINSQEAGIILFCDLFKTIEEHAQLYLNSFPNSGLSLRDLQSKIETYSQKGFLIDEGTWISNLLARARKNPPSKINQGIEIVAIPTANRPEELDRALESFIENCISFGRTPEFVIADDSEPETLRKNKIIIAKHSQTYDGIITHLDYSARQKQSDNIMKSYSGNKKVVDFAILGNSSSPIRTGSLRNSILLYGAGKKILSVDDDVICRTRTISGVVSPMENLILTSTPEHKTWFFNDYESAVNYFPEIKIDYLGIHETMLGKSVDEVLLEVPGKIITNSQSGGISNKFFNSIDSANSHKKIALTHSGFVGHSWSRVHTPTMINSGSDTKHRLWGDSAERYYANRDSMHLARASNDFALYKGTSAVSLNIGIDASVMLPPFMPLYRSQDSVFGHTIQLCFPNIFSGFVPVLVEHKRKDLRRAHNDAALSLTNVGKITVYALSIVNRNLDPNSPTLLSDLGKKLINVSTNAKVEFENDLLSMLVMEFAKYSAYLHALPNTYPLGPAYWKDDIAVMAQSALEASLNIQNVPLFWDVPEWLSTGDPWNCFFEWLKKYGEVISEWPHIFEASLRIDTKDKQP